MEVFRLVFGESKGQRLDQFLAKSLPDFSRSRLQALIREGAVEIGGEKASKSAQLIESGTVIIVRVPPTAPSGISPEAIPLDIAYEDRDVIVVNKPAGLVAHPGAGHAAGTLVNAALAHDPSMQGVGGEQRPGIVHRLDKDTSGLMILAKNDAALHWMQRQFESRSVRKTYLALVDGKPPSRAGRIEAPIGRDPNQRKRMAIQPEGKGRAAVTEYSTRETFRLHSLLEVHPLTGRTHQVRVHCAFLGCPVTGDRVYGRKRPTVDLERHFLHAWKLEVMLPSETALREFVAPLPMELERVLAHLRNEESGG